MREGIGLYRGKREYDGEWVYGYYYKAKYYRTDTELLDYITIPHPEENWRGSDNIIVTPESVGEYTGLTDKNGKKIFEGDIVQYQNLMEFDIQSVVKFGEYKQDGSGGEYGASKCLGFYVEVDNFTCPDWCDNQPECFNDHWRTDNLLQVNENCEVIGNIHDNPEMLEEKK